MFLWQLVRREILSEEICWNFFKDIWRRLKFERNWNLQSFSWTTMKKYFKILKKLRIVYKGFEKKYEEINDPITDSKMRLWEFLITRIYILGTIYNLALTIGIFWGKKQYKWIKDINFSKEDWHFINCIK